MAKYGNPGPDEDMSEESLYGSPEPMGEGEGAENESAESVDQEEAEGAEQTAVISNKILSPEGEPLKPGDEIVLQVVKNYGDESEVKYAPHKPGEDEGGGETGGEYADDMMGEKELAGMSEKGY